MPETDSKGTSVVIVCGVDLKSSEARLAIVSAVGDAPHHNPCKTKKLTLGDHKSSESVRALLQAIRTFSHENKIDIFAIKARSTSGQMAGGAVSFKIEGVFQLSDTRIFFVNAVALSKFAKTNLGGIPNTVLKYQEDAFLCGAYCLHRNEEL